MWHSRLQQNGVKYFLRSILKFIYSENAKNLAKSPPIIWLAVYRANNWWRFRKILWPSQKYENMNFYKWLVKLAQIGQKFTNIRICNFRISRWIQNYFKIFLSNCTAAANLSWITSCGNSRRKRRSTLPQKNNFLTRSIKIVEKKLQTIHIIQKDLFIKVGK